jgi:hypothetical protein
MGIFLIHKVFLLARVVLTSAKRSENCDFWSKEAQYIFILPKKIVFVKGGTDILTMLPEFIAFQQNSTIFVANDKNGIRGVRYVKVNIN